MHPDINTQQIKIERGIFQSIFTFISPTITVIAQHYIGLQKNTTRTKKAVWSLNYFL
jgi:hypothetical protein